MTATAKRFDVVGLGVSTLDFLMVVDELPGAELVQRAERTLLQGGGPVATALVSLARLGLKTAMIDRLGDDWRGRQIREEFEREGVATDYLCVAAGCTSSIASILVRKGDGARTIVYAPGDAGELAPQQVSREAIAGARVLHLNGRHLAASLAAARLAQRLGVTVSFDGGAHRYRDELRELVALSDICIVARQFAASFSGSEDLELCAAKLLACGPKTVVITAGTEGSRGWDHTGQRIHQPALATERAVDTTGAGDAYHGAFLFGTLSGYPLERCLAFASAVAALNTRELGGRSSLPALPEALQFLLDQQKG